MKRALLLGSVLVVAACGGKKTFDSVCANQVPPPAACNTSCDPAAGSTTACASGYHCNANGKCDAVCTPGGTECGSGFACTADGYCVDDGSGGGGGDVDACPSVHFTAAKTTPSIQLLIDRSGSMLNNFADKKPVDGNDPVKYPTEVTALVGAQGVVTTLQGAVYFGASMYPSNACPAILRVGRALNNASAITTLLNSNPPYSQDMDGIKGTPTPTSIDAVVADFQANPPPAGSPPIILLATDGLPNSCMDTSSTAPQSVAAAANAYAKGIRLFVLSVGNATGTTADHFLKLANAGQGVTAGQPNAKYYPATSPAQLQAAFNEIISGVLSCDLTLSGPVKPDEAQNGTVTLNGNQLKYGTDWTVAADGLTLRILGNACTTLKNSANPAVDATFSCNAVIIF